PVPAAVVVMLFLLRMTNNTTRETTNSRVDFLANSLVELRLLHDTQIRRTITTCRGVAEVLALLSQQVPGLSAMVEGHSGRAKGARQLVVEVKEEDSAAVALVSSGVDNDIEDTPLLMPAVPDLFPDALQ
ncbi:hypothetical protein Q7P35_009841, partial [Cladosporium inversicolor]